MTHLLVAIVSHNSARDIGACLRALPDAIGPEATYTVVVADNASEDQSVDVIIDVCPDAIVLALESNRGYAGGINAALEASTAMRFDALLVLNPDVRLDRGAVVALLAGRRQPGIGIVVPRLRGVDGVLQPSLRRDPTVLRALGESLLGGRRAGRFSALGEIVIRAEAYERETVADWATGAAMLIDRACLDATGPWDTSYFLYSEETDYCLRARDLGYRLLLRPDARAVHVGGESNSSPQLWSLLVRNRVRLFRRRHGFLRGLAFWTVIFAGESIRAAAGRRTSRAAVRSLLGVEAMETLEPPADGIDGFVCFSAQDWWYFNRGHSDFQLMTRAARTHPVLLVNSIGMRLPTRTHTTMPLTRIMRKVRSARMGLTAPVPGLPNFHVFTPLFLPVYGNGVVASLGHRLVLAQVRQALRRLGVARPAVVVTLPTAWPIAARLRRGRLIAYRSDRYSELPEANRESVRSLECDLLAAADIAMFASCSLHDRERTLTRRPTLLSHGIDLDQFRLANELIPHPRIAERPGPHIGYVGMIDGYTTDLGLIERVACDHPDADIVLAGPLDVAISAVLALPNVRHIGVLPFDEVPSFLAGLDVAIMPWQQNSWIEHCNPIKLKEYLAAGLAVVTTAFPEILQYGDVVTIASSGEEFSGAIGHVLAHGGPGTPADRRAAVRAETWDIQASRLVQLAETLTEPPDRLVLEAG